MVLYFLTPLPSSLHIRVLLATYTLSISAYIHCIVSAPMPLSPIPVIVVFRRHGTASIDLCISRRLCPHVGDPGLHTEYKRDNNEGSRWRTRADEVSGQDEEDVEVLPRGTCGLPRLTMAASRFEPRFSHTSYGRDLVHAAFVQTTMR